MMEPWSSLPEVSWPVVLEPDPAADAALADAVDLPSGSALTLARLDTATGRIRAARWRGTGLYGFYPASTVKLITGVLLIEALHGLNIPLDASAALGDEPPQPLRPLLADMIRESGNDSFNTLAEIVGFAETHAALRNWGCVKALVRRNFARPRYNHSRAVTLLAPSGQTLGVLPPRPPVDLPLNDSHNTGRPDGGDGQSNWFCTDDFIRVLAATFAGPYRRRPGYAALADDLAHTNQCFPREGLAEIGRYAIWNKPGWWPDDLANSDLCYICDIASGCHYFLGIHCRSTVEDARPLMAAAARDAMKAAGVMLGR